MKHMAVYVLFLVFKKLPVNFLLSWTNNLRRQGRTIFVVEDEHSSSSRTNTRRRRGRTFVVVEDEQSSPSRTSIRLRRGRTVFVVEDEH